MEPKSYLIENEWVHITLSGTATLQVKEGKVFLGFEQSPEYEKDAFIIPDVATLKDIEIIYLKTAANNRKPSRVVIGSTES